MAAVRLLLGLVLCAAVPLCAQADIYTFTDADGITHYSNVPADPRFAVLFRDPVPAAPAAAAAGAGGDWRQRAALYAALIDGAARGAAVQPALLRAVIAVESGFNPDAQSRKGAQGLMQLVPATARRYGVRQPFDPEQNLRGGAHYLSDLLKRYDNHVDLALAAYNAGEDAVDSHGRRIPPFPETQAYVPAVLKWYRQFLRGAQVASYTRTLPPAT
jgi:soluble lytic murein transglycosylase-like protein